MTALAERTLDWLMARGPVAGVMRRRVRLVVLAYHGVDDQHRFAAHLDHLQEHFTVVSLDEVLAALDGAALPARAALITFDDGERSVLEAGVPELRRRSLPAVLFAVPGVLDSDRPFWWVEAERLVEAGATSSRLPASAGPAAVVRHLKQVPDLDREQILEELRAGRDTVRTPQLTSDELAGIDAAGVRVENHSLTHPLLDRCTDAKIAAEIDTAHDRLTEILGRPPVTFAYPNGNVDRRVVGHLRRRNYRAAFLFDHALAAMPGEDPLCISRVRVNSTTTLDRFAAITAGVHPALHRLRGGS